MALQAFNVDIVRVLDAERLAWVSGDDAADQLSLCGNQDYMDLRGAGWPWVEETIALERGLLARFAQEPESELAYLAYRDEIYGDEDNLLASLDLGVASVVLGLSAAGCVPCSSCNGGALGDGGHTAECPSVVFYLRRDLVGLVMTCAEDADVGLEQTQYGEVVVYARDVADLVTFAAALLAYREMMLPTP